MTDGIESERETKTAVLRGLKKRCPRCGQGKLFTGFLKVTDRCSLCGEELYHHRADDGPAYLTILIVAHVIGFVLHATFGYLRDDPLILALLLSALALIMSLLLLPRLKGLIVGVQWAKRMHGFGTARGA
jgi:uncharacterized protein (DUF983 family)